MDDYVEQFACKLDEAKVIAEKMSVNQKVEVLKYVFQFIEQLQRDLIEKLTRHGSIVTFSFVPEIGIENCLKTVVSQTAYSYARRMKQERQDQVLDAHESNYFDQSVSCKLEKIQNHGNSAEASYGLVEGCSQEPLLNRSEDGGSLLRVIRDTDGDFNSCAAAESTSTRSFENTVCKNSRTPLPTHGKRPDDDDDDDDEDHDDIILTATQNEEFFADSSVTEPAQEFTPESCKGAHKDGAKRAKRRRRSRKKSKLGRPSIRERINGKYFCTFPGCTERYASLEHVTDHELQHTVPDGHFYSCEHCAERFKWRHYLRIHVKSNHIGEASPATKLHSFNC